MRTIFKLIAVAAAFGLAPAAVAQAPEPLPAQPQMELPAAPQDASAPPLASEGEPPADETVAETTYVSSVMPEPGIGQPDGRMGLQDQFGPIGEEAAWFHDYILMPAITIISLLVLALLAWVIIRYRRAANPNPSRTTHNTLLEVAWTLIPVLILVVIAVPSIRLLANQYSPPDADVTIKAIGNQWYWTYEYPDHGIDLVSNMLSDEEAAARGEPRLLAVDERVVVPEGATVKLIVTASDVIHAFALPAFWVKIDAVPGRLNETWFRADRPGIYYGQCSELCGARHAYMPIAVEVVPQAEFERWVASRGGTMPGAEPPAETLEADVAAGTATETMPAPPEAADVTATPVVAR
jgi:cytochrome c oxidase subunit II